MTHPKKAKRAGKVSTKGGTGKSTGPTNLGAFTADAGLRTLLIDLDPVQPSASSYFPLEYTAPGGIFELLSYNETDPAKIISRTSIKNLDVINTVAEGCKRSQVIVACPSLIEKVATQSVHFQGQIKSAARSQLVTRPALLNSFCHLLGDPFKEYFTFGAVIKRTRSQ
ncbi:MULTISPECIES: ParA family protein [Pseudomonas]|uniref:ParA family protein n=1 Tax=Pseudomonas TaxID=286 RepID=UPI0009BCA140